MAALPATFQSPGTYIVINRSVVSHDLSAERERGMGQFGAVAAAAAATTADNVVDGDDDVTVLLSIISIRATDRNHTIRLNSQTA